LASRGQDVILGRRVFSLPQNVFYPVSSA
jgi:hypothetical protein